MLSEKHIQQALHASRVVPLAVAKPHGPLGLEQFAAAVARAVARVRTRRPRVRIEPRPLAPGDSPLTWADISKASRVLGYRPATPLREGLVNFVKWYRESGVGLVPRASDRESLAPFLSF